MSWFPLLLLLLPLSTEAAEIILDTPGPQGPLQGTLRLPATPPAAAIIIPGSGPTDRDGNNPLGVKGSIYRQLAEALAQQGIATLRIDKRGLFGSAAAIPDPNHVTIANYATDVQAWTKLLQARTALPCIWLIGHSEGGLIALAAAQDSAGLCGLILLSTPGEPLAATLQRQLNAAKATQDTPAPPSPTPQQDHQIPPTTLALFPPQVRNFIIDAATYDPADLLAHTTLPTLIIQGTQDLQITVASAQRLAQANPAAQLTLLDGLNHVLKHVPTPDRAANLATYANPDLPIDPAVPQTITGFILHYAQPPPK